MSLAYLFDSNIQFQDKSGNNNVNGFLRVYIDNTDDRAVTYKDFNGTLNQADIRLDNNGRAVVIVDDSKTYRLEVYGTTGVLLWTLYPISPKATGINETLEALVAAVKSHTIAIEGLALGKKNRQQAKVISGTPTQTVKSLSQNADGEITVEFEDIAFPHKVLVDGEDSEPKYLEDAVKADENGLLLVRVDEKEDSTPEHPDKVLVIDDSNLVNEIERNAQRIEDIEEALDEMDMDSVPHAYLHSTLIHSAGDSSTTRTTVDIFACDGTPEGDCFEFEQTTTIDDTPYGYLWIEPGTYLINGSVTLQWVGNPRGTFVAKVGSVMGENFDFSQEQEILRNHTKIVTIPNRMKLALNVTYDAGTPLMGFWIQSLQVVKLAGGMSQTTVAHGLSLEGNGSVEQPLDVSEHGLREAFDYAKDKEYFATKQEIVPLATKSALQAETARAMQRENEIEELFTLPTQEAVDAWLNAHPEATTTVEDRSLTGNKLVLGTLNFVTPEMFGAVGDGVTDDTEAISACLNSEFPVDLGGKTYKVAREIHISKLIARNGTFIIPESTTRLAVFVSLSMDTNAPYVELNNVRFVTGRTQGYNWAVDMDRPLSNAGSYSNIVLFHISAGDGNKVLSFKARNCEFLNVEYVLKHDSHMLGQNIEFDSCNFVEVTEVVITYADTLSVKNCYFKQYEYADHFYHFIYFKGTENTKCRLYVDNCSIDSVNYAISPSPGADVIPGVTYEVYVSNCRVVCNAFSVVWSNSKHYYRNCDVTARLAFFAAGSDNSIHCCDCTFRWNPDVPVIPDDVSSIAFSFPVDAVVENCDISIPLSFRTEGSRNFEFINCTIRQFDGNVRAMRCIGVQASIRFFNCRLLGGWNWQFGDMTCAQAIEFIRCYIYAGAFFNHYTGGAYRITLRSCNYIIRNTQTLNLTVLHDYKEFGYENVSSTGTYVPKLVNGILTWVQEI